MWGGAALVSAEARLGDVIGDVGHAFHAAGHDDVGLGSRQLHGAMSGTRHKMSNHEGKQYDYNNEKHCT